MSLDRRLLFWGVFFILVGAVALAVRLGYVGTDVAGRWWLLWPLLIVGAGLGLILRRTPFDALGRLVVAGTLGLMVGGLLATGFAFPGPTCGGGNGGVAFTPKSGTFGPDAQVQIELDCGAVRIGAADGSDWRIDGSGPNGTPPQVTAGQDRLVLKPADRNIPFFEPAASWTVTLPRSTHLGLDLTVNAGEGRANLSGASLGDINVTLNAGSTRLDLGSAASLANLGITVNAGSGTLNLPALNLRGSVTVNAGSIAFCVPEGTGLRIRANDQLTASNNYAAQGLARAGDTWTSPGFEAAATHIELDTTANAGSMTLNPGGGCNG